LLLVAPLLAACTGDAKPAVAKPLPSERAQEGRDICKELLPPSALAVLESSGVRAEGAPRAVAVPLTPPGVTSSVATEGCEVRLDGAPLEGAQVRRVLDAEAVSKLRKGIKLTTDEVDGGPDGWVLRWSDAASTTFAFRADDSNKEAYVVQLVLQRPNVDRKKVVQRLTSAVLDTVAR
jgi:hypothetical protein